MQVFKYFRHEKPQQATKMHTHKHPKICLQVGLQTRIHTCRIWPIGGRFSILPNTHTHPHTHLWLAFVHSVRQASTSHTSSDSFCSLCVCSSAHTKALVNRIKVSLRSTTLSAHTPACLWRCWRNDSAAGSHAATFLLSFLSFLSACDHNTYWPT